MTVKLKDSEIPKDRQFNQKKGRKIYKGEGFRFPLSRNVCSRFVSQGTVGLN